MQSKKNIQIIKSRLLEHFKGAKSELNFKNNYDEEMHKLLELEFKILIPKYIIAFPTRWQWKA